MARPRTTSLKTMRTTKSSALRPGIRALRLLVELAQTRRCFVGLTSLRLLRSRWPSLAECFAAKALSRPSRQSDWRFRGESIWSFISLAHRTLRIQQAYRPKSFSNSQASMASGGTATPLTFLGSGAITISRCCSHIGKGFPTASLKRPLAGDRSLPATLWAAAKSFATVSTDSWFRRTKSRKRRIDSLNLQEAVNSGGEWGLRPAAAF